ncbi:protein AzlC [Oceaniovalibus guishaninsula JLT2003]|uniref:Protein AzlC n=1 Tax=Oceaniovalibus guishaninsula JLT2003 TaxID=1231392 RepID=K2I4E2_9RHOB|nr:AzlC family ABC transporter permease [Oceaniovalibus guishaninsula]EKE43740.1 protein AzlC [Oceaniovalibus guishaninsula JLT2003]
MAGSTTKSAYWRGVVLALPFLLVVGPFAMLFGVVATEAGLPLLETMAFSALVIAGASQFAALQMMVEDASVWAILATGLAVNLRMAMYSAALVPWLGEAPLWQRALISYLNFDQSYAAAVTEYERRPAMSVRERVATFLGIATPIGPGWYLFTLIGALAGSNIPESWALDFALPITFIALIGPMLRTPAHLVAAGTSIVLALALAGMPPGTGLLLAGAGAMCAGAATEVWAERRWT